LTVTAVIFQIEDLSHPAYNCSTKIWLIHA